MLGKLSANEDINIRVTDWKRNLKKERKTVMSMKHLTIPDNQVQSVPGEADKTGL